MRLSRFITALSVFAETVLAGHHAGGHDAFLRQRDEMSTYEYIVVGSGIGGGPVAANLAIAGYKVLLIDAGGDSGEDHTEGLPAMHLYATEYEKTRWNFFVNHYSDLERQKKDSKMTYQNPDGSYYVGFDPPADAEPLGILYPRAGSLGGCSRHNALITMYGHDSDWEYIASLTGDDSWSPDNMREHFKTIEHNNYLPSSIVGHGFKGWLWTSLTSLSLVVEDQKLLSLILSAATAMGQTLLGGIVHTVTGLANVLLTDLNAPGATSREGLYQVPLSMRADNIRGGPRDFILDTAAAVNADGSRKYHLDIKLDTLVTKIRFDDSKTAVGVDFIEGASLYRADPRSAHVSGPSGSGAANATREVVLSAGTFNTPQLLKLSGVGPANELARHDIPLVADLPGVGRNMQDRYEATLIARSSAGDFRITTDCTFLQTSPDPCLDEFEAGIGPVTRGTYGTNGIAIAAVVRSSSASEDDGEEPDLLISGAPANFMGYYPGVANDSLADAQHWAWIVLKGHSRNNAGTVELRSTDPRDTPLINFRSFDEGVNGAGEAGRDLQAVYEGMEWARRAFKSVIPLDGNFDDEVWPGPEAAPEGDEAAMKRWVQNEAWGHHASCTCAIGADGDPNAVLDGDFRVRGVNGLRVVDASVFPKIPGFYIALPLYIVSQKASEVIIRDAVASDSS